MKLIGSRAESESRKQILDAHEYHFQTDSSLKKALESSGHPIGNAYILSWIPDQDNDLFLVLIDSKYLLSCEIERDGNTGDVEFERTELYDYKNGLSRTGQIELAVAMELANEQT